MILNVSVTEYRRELTHLEIGLARDRLTVATLRREHVPNWFANPTNFRMRADFGADGRGFQPYVDRYSEVATSEPWKDIELYFERKEGVGYAPAGALFYSDNRPILNTAALASATEALAGWFCEERYGWTLAHRPQRVSPDMVFTDNANDRLALVEVKSSSVQVNVIGRLTANMIDLLRILAFTKYLSPARYFAALIMVQLVGPDSVNLTSLVLEET